MIPSHSGMSLWDEYEYAFRIKQPSAQKYVQEREMKILGMRWIYYPNEPTQRALISNETEEITI